ncbi:hypothetical protein RZE82_04265 [Mollicutes bacterium LVI A0039]|nr:hypothetical protein RZE82_04265 [Mollicutes bacterium LVI A0039]
MKDNEFRVLRIDKVRKLVLLEIDTTKKLYKDYKIELFDSLVKENSIVTKYCNEDNDEFIFMTNQEEKL